MQRSILTKLLVAAAVLALACTGDRNALPTQAPDFDVQAAVTCGDAALANKIKAEIKYLYPNKPSLLNAAQTRFTSVQTKCSQNKIADAQTQAIQLAGFAVAKYQNHQLFSYVTPKDVSDHVNDLYTYVGLPAPGDITGALSSGAAAAVVGPTDPPTDVKTGDQKAGVHIGTGDISAMQTVLVTITPDPTGNNVFPNTAGLKEFPPFYDFQTFPDVALFNRPVLVGICVDLTGVPSDQAHRLQLAHAKRPDKTSLEILARADAGFLPCNSFVSAGSDALMIAQSGRRSFVGTLAERALALFRPQPLHAATLVLPGGLGGLTSNFTDFRAVDPGKLVFTTQPTNTPAGLFITPAPTVTVEREDNTTITNFTGTVTVAIGTNPSAGTLSGTTTVALTNGVATFSNLSIDKPGSGYTLTATGTSPTGAVPAPATSTAFDITEFSDGFEHESGWSATGFWNRNSMVGITNSAYPIYVNLADGDQSGGALPMPFAGSYAFWYGQSSSGNYMGSQVSGDGSKSGGTSMAPNSGVLTSPAFFIPDQGLPVALRFDTWWEIESVNPKSFDIMRVSIQDVVTSAVTELGVLNPTTDPGGAPPTPFTSGGFNTAPVWMQVTQDVTAFRGKTVRLIFTFDTRDILYNGFRGWLIDNVSVTTQSLLAAPLAPQASGLASLRTGTLSPEQPRRPRQ